MTDKPEQLKMFMTAPEIKSQVTNSMDLMAGESMPQLWERKWRQADRPSSDVFDENDKPVGPSLRQSIKEHGFQQIEPIHLTHGYDKTLADAHHRVEVMSRLHPDQFLAVKHHAALSDLSTTGRWVSDYHEAARKRRVADWPEGQM